MYYVHNNLNKNLQFRHFLNLHSAGIFLLPSDISIMLLSVGNFAVDAVVDDVDVDTVVDSDVVVVDVVVDTVVDSDVIDADTDVDSDVVDNVVGIVVDTVVDTVVDSNVGTMNSPCSISYIRVAAFLQAVTTVRLKL